ncbi:MAG: DUF3857 domain-containing protein [Flavobacterium sp.]|nr:DUF3857 domain-containing protein [Flavobacterium sp.]
MKWIFFAVISITTSVVFSQKIAHSYSAIADSLKQNANAIVRLDQMDITISSQREMILKKVRIVTVLNESGRSAIDAIESYDKRTVVKSIEATIFDAFGNEIKKIKRKDFKDQCAIDGATLFSDNRVVFLEYTPTQYPFTVAYESEVKTSNTAFVPSFYFITRYDTSVEKSHLNVKFPDNLGFRKKEFNFSNFAIVKTLDNTTQLSYEVTNILAQKAEYFSQDGGKVFPWVMMGLEQFNLEGIDGQATTWKEFGQWYTDKILFDTTKLPDETKNKMVALVGKEEDPIKKARIIYDYLQQKTRYVSIQVGVGGFKPMLAKDVDRLGYGDCKALSNYTQALLSAVGVTSYPTLLYGDRNKRNIQEDFVSVQGNHMILAIRTGTDYCWLECTSQDAPFGYQANFTDDRLVLVVKPEGGEIVRTKNYQDADNGQYSIGHYEIAENGLLSGSIEIVSDGSQYGYKYQLESKSPIEKEEYYKEYWSYINNLKLNKIVFANDKNQIKFTEKVHLEAASYGSFSADKLLFPVNVFNQHSGTVKKIRNRRSAFEIQRGSYDSDEITISFPTGYVPEFLPKDFELKTKFGEYKTELTKSGTGKLLYKRIFLLKKGTYQSSEYEGFRSFLDQISRNDNAKIIIIKNQ